MKTSSKIFAIIFSLFFLVATVAAICGYTHQWAMAFISGFMASSLWAEVLHKEDPSQNVTPLK